MDEEILRKFGFDEELKKIKNKECPICGELINLDDFKDNLSFREFQISGMCAKCQEETFTEPNF